jgi:hypothetical protein
VYFVEASLILLETYFSLQDPHNSFEIELKCLAKIPVLLLRMICLRLKYSKLSITSCFVSVRNLVSYTEERMRMFEIRVQYLDLKRNNTKLEKTAL